MKCFFILLLCTPSFASSFIAAIDVTQPSKTILEIESEIRQFALIPGNYLSLGESHLEANTTFPIMMKFAETYQNSVGNQKKQKACIETNIGFHQFGMPWLNDHFTTVDVRTLNSPALTDFLKCYDSDYAGHLIYSGLFHQFKWAPFFGNLFDPSAVQNGKSNTIDAQLTPGKGYFVSQIELSYILSLESRNILKIATQSPEQFNTLITALKDQVQAIRKKMEVLHEGSNAWSKKMGLILTGKSFKTALPIPTKAHLILTDLDYRLAQSPTFFLDQIVKLSTQSKDAFFRLMKANKWYFQQTFIERDVNGKPGTITIGDHPVNLEGESTFLWLALKKNRLLMAISNSEEGQTLQCVSVPVNNEQPEKKITGAVVDCEDALTRAE